ncbi:glutamate receptor-like [Palaemon carinicauda]|uniref:glutamate receptor-like n=1 Tax=Palaemon carinicauda TaxID=392227 RepID=UPI0035B603CB
MIGIAVIVTAHNRLVCYIASLSCLLQTVRSTYRDGGNDAIISSSGERAKFVLDVSYFVQELYEDVPLHLQILYDRDYEGIANVLINLLSGKLNGLTIYERGESNNTSVEMLLRPSKDVSILMTICTASNVLQIFEQIRAKRLDSHFVTWLLVSEGELEAEFLLVLKNSIFEGTRVLILFKDQFGDLLIKHSEADAGGDIRFLTHNARHSHWKAMSPDILTTRGERMYANMEGRQMLVAAIDGPPVFKFRGILPDGSYEPEAGISLDILNNLARYLNFTYKVYQPSDGKFGYPQPDGSVTGLIGMVARREVQLAICGIALNWRREEVIDYAYPHLQGYLRIFSRSPKARSRVLAILSPFTSQVWLCIIAFTLIIGPVAYTAVKANRMNIGEDIHDLDLQVSTFNMFRNLVNQGNQLHLRYWPQRFLVFSWILFCLIISGWLTLSDQTSLPPSQKQQLASVVVTTGQTPQTQTHMAPESTRRVGRPKSTWLGTMKREVDDNE